MSKTKSEGVCNFCNKKWSIEFSDDYSKLDLVQCECVAEKTNKEYKDIWDFDADDVV